MVEHYGNTFTLTYEEKIVIEMIIEGCTRLICTTSEDDPLKYARARLHHKTKPLVHTFVILHIHDMIKENPTIVLRILGKAYLKAFKIFRILTYQGY
jgi:hypothetical protein